MLAWFLSILTFAATVGFFALMGLDAPFLSRVVYGRWITLANALAAVLIGLFLASIALFAWRAAHIDEQLAMLERKR
jgi:uncharacterized membrane protein (DUF485 family)